MAEYQFQTEVNQLLKLIIHSMYSNKEIFLREIISNASDALDKLNYLKVSNDSYKDIKSEPRIDIFFDTKDFTLTVKDTGIGMNEKDLTNNLGTIAKSGTKAFLEKISKDKNAGDSNLIGQFGVGFYSAFMAAKQINVYTRKAGGKKILKWSSDGTNSYSIEEVKAKTGEAAKYGLDAEDACGTAVEMILNNDSKGYADRWRIEGLIKRYSDHIAFPIFLHYVKTEYDDKGNEKGSENKTDQINSASALWKKPKSELKKEDYDNFYKTFSHDNDEPLHYVHTHAEGAQEYTTLFYVPKNPPFDMFQGDYKSGVKLYVKRVFITDSDRELLPPYLRFIRGIIDSEEHPLNVSRELLQQNRILENIKYSSMKKLLSEFKKMGDDADEARKTPEDKRSEQEKAAIEKWNLFVTNYNRLIKEGIYGDFRNKDELLEIVRFKSTDESGIGDGNWTSLAGYVSRMKPDQKSIYYATGSNESNIRHNPALEAYISKGFEVLISADQMDDMIISSIDKYKDFRLLPIDRTSSAEELSAGNEEEIKKKEEEFKPVQEKIKKALDGKVTDVVLSKRLTDSPSCISFSDYGPDYQTEKILRALGQNAPTIIPILEINADHKIVRNIAESKDEAYIANISEVLLYQAMLMAGAEISDPSVFVKSMNELLSSK